MEEDKAESGLAWGFEIESLVLEILEMEEVDEIYENDLVEILFQRKELQPLLAQFVERVQQYPELAKEYGWKNTDFPKTAKEELRVLLKDVTDGNWHAVPTNGFGAHRKLSRWLIRDGDIEYITIRRVKDESNNIKRS
ncbi:MAG: hypothetical protein K8Q89_02520 [Nitrosarchaeum sp.]|nr:hypothetical protein [Nitrosarchaeum sp.]